MSMEQMSILAVLLMPLSWIKYSGATNCTVYLSSQPLTLNLLCPSAICRLELLNMRGCNNGCPSCNIDDCNKVYGLCNTTQSLLVNVSSESSPQRLPSTWPAVPSNEQPINCTFVQIPNMDLMVTCRKGEYQLTFKSNTSACSRDLGINCHLDDPAATCIRVYDLCMEPQPNPCLPSSDTVSTTALNQCTNSVTIQTCTEKVPITTYLRTLVYIPTTVHVSAYPSPTTTLISHNIMTSSPTNTNQGILLNIALPATGGLVGLLIVLLLVVVTGWVCTCQIMKKRGKMVINMTQDRPCTNDGLHTYTKTRRFDNPHCEEQQQSTSASPPSTKPNPPQRQREEPVYAISLVTNRRDIEEPRNIPNGPNQALSGGGMSVGGATLIPKKQGEIEHKYDHLVKVVKQTERGQRKGYETTSLERNHNHYTSDKQERDTTYHIQDYLTPIKQRSKSFQNTPNKALLPDEGALGGVVPQFPPRKQGEIEHQYDHLIEIAKQKGGQSKRDEGDDGEIDHGYHVLEGPDNDYDDLDEQERVTVNHILDGPTPVEPELKTFQNGPKKVFPAGGVSVGGATQFPRKQTACEHQYDHLVKVVKKGSQSKRYERADEERDHGYHVLEGPGDDDYDYPDEQEGEIVYHVLDGPTPVEEETQFIY